MRSGSERRAILAFAVIAALVAGVGSYFAYSRPDALEHSVSAYAPAGQAIAQSTDAQYKGPLSGYNVPGLARPAVSGGLAGLIGAAMTFVAIAGAGFALSRARRRERGRHG
jgi:hypothetical protein